MRTVKCDLCNKIEPEVDCKYSNKKKFGWFKHYEDSQGGYDRKLDICKNCWAKIESYILLRNKEIK